jgi:uncharacterized membrane protein YkvA (DUF1232 family)
MDVGAARGLGRKVVGYFRCKQVPIWRKLLGLGALAYVVLPFDAVPDVLPLVGWLDDVGVVGAVAAFVLRDVRRWAPAPEEGSEDASKR